MIDAYVCRIVCWRFSRTAHAAFVLAAMQTGPGDRRPIESGGLVHHSDRRVHTTRSATLNAWQRRAAAQSVGSIGNSYDAALAESIKGLHKTEVMRRCAKGSRPRAPRDQRYEWAYLFGAVCQARGIGAALVQPCAEAQAMNLRLGEIGRCVAPGAHAVITLDGVDWNQTGGMLRIRDNNSLLPLPLYSPDLTPIKHIWHFLCQNYLANRVYDTNEAVIDACCNASNALAAAPDIIRSFASRAWAEPVIGHGGWC